MATLTSEFRAWSRSARKARGAFQAHSSLYRLACILLGEGRDRDQTFRVLRAFADGIGDRSIPDRECWSAISYAEKAGGDGAHEAAQRWPRANLQLRAELETRWSLRDLRDSCRVPTSNGREVFDHLFRQDDLICLGVEVNQFFVGVMSQGNLGAAQFTVPNPMKGPHGKTQDGRRSPRCNDNVLRRAYQVVEFDWGSFDHHASLLLHLSESAPLVLAVYSGGKSLHGWFDVGGWLPEQQRDFFAQAVELGADPKMWAPSQFTRMPWGQNRKTQRHQVVYYFSPPDRG